MSLKVENLSKKFLIRHDNRPRYQTLRDKLSHNVSSLIKAKSSSKEIEEFWALKDVSFSINPGDRLAVIGNNGAGKSTLLKVLSRITPPTKGKISIEGRVASLLEVGTGFHPELTGKENIFLNGALLGMTRREILSKFDEIVDFAGTEKFLDTPVKRYSSGMYVRLAFSVAAHLESDLLFIDEVLAVGDARFQKKCIGKMEEVTRNGRTIIFVSHNMGALNFCNKGVLLEKGSVIPTSSLEECIAKYSEQHATLKSHQWTGNEGDSEVRILRFSLGDGNHKEFFPKKQKTTVDISLEILKPVSDLIVGLLIYNKNGVLLVHHKISTQEHVAMDLQPGRYSFRSQIDFSIFSEGIYRMELDVGIHNVKRISKPEIAFSFQVLNEEKRYGETEGALMPEWGSEIIRT